MDQNFLTVTSLIKRLEDIKNQFGDLEVRLSSNYIKGSDNKVIYPIFIITSAPKQHKKIVMVV